MALDEQRDVVSLNEGVPDAGWTRVLPQELQLDTGWRKAAQLPELNWRWFPVWIFTVMRNDTVSCIPPSRKTTARAIEACEAVREFFGGTLTVLIPDNTKAIVATADPIATRITPAFLEYGQACYSHRPRARTVSA